MSYLEKLNKAAEAGTLHKVVREMALKEDLSDLLPDVQEMIGCTHDATRGHHMEGDAYAHTLLVMQSSKPGLIPQLAALFHDVGKPHTRVDEGDKVSFIGHAKAGAPIALAACKVLGVSDEVADAVEHITTHHMRPHDLLRQDATSDKAIRRFIRKVGADMVPYILDLAEADRRGNLPCTGEDLAPYKELRAKVFTILAEKPAAPPIIGAAEVMEILDIGPGPEVGKAMRLVKHVTSVEEAHCILIQHRTSIHPF